MSTLPLALSDIEAARERIAGAVLHTPCVPAPRLSMLTGAEVFVKYENLQVTNAFKERGAANRLALLDESERARGVVAMSAGNHAQAVARHAARLGIAATIVMPKTTPFSKVAATENWGAEIVLEGENVQDCEAVMHRLVDERGLVVVHPYDDLAVMAGQGTLALEMLADAPGLDAILVPVGGGGLISGVATAANALRPEIEIHGVQSIFYPALDAALRGETATCGGDTLAEGIAVRRLSPIAVDIARALVDDVILVDEDAIEAAIYAFFAVQKTMAEGAGAAGLAALMANRDRFTGRRVGLILCGGNIDPRMLSAITVRALERQQRIVSLRVTVRDRPGILGRIATIVGETGANILDVSHQRMLLNVPATGATVDLTVETRDEHHALRVRDALMAQGMRVMRLDPVLGSDPA
ncbi:MAG: threonine ammonia-lyase [Rhodobiaceae bacterium]|nr:threonine ammonia-lyase [Rhodobiaceae bacterium]MCC0041623.1 threonine ammonia-lyase [Rhodobiaceae bacterium]